MQTKPVRILLIDDDEDDFVVTRDILNEIEKKQFQLSWKDNYEEGLQVLRQLDHDIYLVDYQLGARSGLDLLAEAQKLACTAPIIILTGQDDTEVDEAALEAGASDYLVKERLDANQLDRAIRYALQRSALVQRLEIHSKELSDVNVKLHNAMQAKDNFLASMSHELRTPLTGIIGMSEVLQDDMFGQLNDKQQEYIGNIHHSGQHLLALINDILDIAKSDVTELGLDISQVNVADLCESVLRLVKSPADKYNHTLCLKIASDISIIEADPRRLKQILVNLLSNAIKFTAEGGKINFEVELLSAKKCVAFHIIDNGQGIAETDIERLFQPFMQLDNSLSKSYEGTGLGLALVERMVKLHGGHIFVKSKEGEGSHFTIQIPLHTMPNSISQICNESIKQNSSHAHWQSKMTQQSQLILLVDDDETNRTIFEDFLRTKDYQVISASNGVDAIMLSEQQHPDLILMDIQMPEMDGLEAIQLIRRQPNAFNTAIIALTALAMTGDKERCLAAGADYYVSKPLSIHKLIEIIETALLEKKASF